MKILKKKQFIVGAIAAIVIYLCVVILFGLQKQSVTDSYYQVIFDSMGGSEVAGQNVLAGEQAKQPSTTVKEGYIFKGWYLDDQKFDFTTIINKDITLEAKWEKIEEEIIESEEGITEEVNQETETLEETTTSQTNQSSTTNNSETTTKQENTTTNQAVPTIIAVTDVYLNKNSMSLKVGESGILSVSVQPSNATDKDVTWTSSNNGVVTVSNGNVRAVGAGTATITATAGGKSASCTVTVTKEITYSYEIVDIPSSSVGQCYIFLNSSEGNRVSGTISITYTTGGSEIVQVPTSGVMKVKSIISSITIISAG